MTDDPTGPPNQPPVPPPPQAPTGHYMQQGQPPPPAPQQPYANPPPAAGTNGLAVASFILGLLWICYIGSVLAVIFGHIALSQIKKTGDTQGGKGLAIAGLVLGYLGIGLLVLSFFTGVASFWIEV